jgi:soluble lytic murein transglycosylase
MTATTWGNSTPVLQGLEPAGRGWAASRRKALAMVLAMSVGAGLSWAVLGLVKQPEPNRAQEQSIYTASAAVETARQAQQKVAEATEKLARAEARIAALKNMGAEQELADFQEAERLGISRYMRNSSAIWGSDRRRVEAAIVREARRNGLDPLLVAAVIQVESRFDPFAVSGVGACGLMQLMPPTAQWLREKQTDDSDSPEVMKKSHLFNPVLNIELGTAYLAQLMSRFDGDMNMALIAYNAGPGTAHSLTPNSKSFKRLAVYPKSVLTAYKALLTPPAQLASR